jgi:hypothetical protein
MTFPADVVWQYPNKEPFIYLGNFVAASKPFSVLKEKKIKNILNVTVDTPGTHEQNSHINFKSTNS